MASLVEVISQFLNPDNNVRQTAEQLLQQHKANPAVFVPQLLELTRTFAEPQMRQMRGVVLRCNLDATMWPAVGALAQQTAKASLFEGFVAEQEPSVCNALADTISKLAAIFASAGAAPFLRSFAITPLCSCHSNLEA
mmetsp:Transcript_66778/g.108336  ORF Transcript_66778/g.108336 Transcript_66778/m.108336 type:complete len:138 (-) Transcript_66778:187-600(-)